jgi:RNA polymerase sigma-70 factor (ECF subfamily)
MSGHDTAEFRALYDRYALSVYRRALRMLGNSPDAWDAVQDVFIRVFRFRDEFRREASAMTYLYRIATNVCLTAIRRRASRESSPDLALVTTTPGEQSRAEARQLLRLLAARLDDRKLAIAALYFVDDLTQDQIAEVVGLSRKTVGLELAEVRSVAQELAPSGGETS